MSNQLRFNGKSIEEALAKARATLGEGVRLVAAERVSKPGLVGKRISFTVVVEPPMAPVSAPGFAAALRSALLTQGPMPKTRNEADVSDYRSVQDDLAQTYGRASTVDSPPAVPKIFRRDGKVAKLATIASPQWSTASSPSSMDPSAMRVGGGVGGSTPPTLGAVAVVDRLGEGHAPATERDVEECVGVVGPPGAELTEEELVAAARRAMSPGAFLRDRIDSLVVDLAGAAPVVDLRGLPFVAETASLAPTTHLVAIVVPTAPDPVERFVEICNELDIAGEHRFVLARRRREIPAAMQSSTNLVARSVMQSSQNGGCTGVLVDAGQLRLLRGSFLDSMMSVVVAVAGTETIARLEREMSPCGQVDALWYPGDDAIATRLGIARLHPSVAGDDR
ncbi:hypothetical protein [Ferrimicrobium sp.]|uniref:hypothetical protein n=1 Tax=Ferrimicrobium sp. TaxID=2926050 RepID=UPI002638D2E1|nr:hypothetical protein [Ferrimicrobium sp.]